MAHYAVLDENNIVTQVFVGKDENEPLPEGYNSWEQYYGAKRTSFNTLGGIHLLGGTPFRKNYASIGYMYDSRYDAFIPPQPFASWTLNFYTFLWEPPVPKPTDEDPDTEVYLWFEYKKEWVKVPLNK
jgi:hypothetical protein